MKRAAPATGSKYKVFNSDSFVLCGFTKGESDHFGALVRVFTIKAG